MLPRHQTAHLSSARMHACVRNSLATINAMLQLLLTVNLLQTDMPITPLASHTNDHAILDEYQAVGQPTFRTKGDQRNLQPRFEKNWLLTPLLLGRST